MNTYKQPSAEPKLFKVSNKENKASKMLWLPPMTKNRRIKSKVCSITFVRKSRKWKKMTQTPVTGGKMMFKLPPLKPMTLKSRLLKSTTSKSTINLWLHQTKRLKKPVRSLLIVSIKQRLMLSLR